MDLKGLVDKAKAALKGNPSLIEKGGDTVNKVTGGKYSGHVDKAQDAVKKAVGSDTPKPENPAPAPSPESPKPEEPKQNPPQA
ncbi:antitoxin [Streptomyces sp. SID6673]|nr:antitoxin [Streptomyces sp. SID11726]NEB23452.1 antitoxin [Streptomyces sp. SID6673]